MKAEDLGATGTGEDPRLTERWESTLVRFEGLTVTQNFAGQPGQMMLAEDETGTIAIDDYFFELRNMTNNANGLWPGFPVFSVDDTVTILGRPFVLDNRARPAMMITYLIIAFWLGGGTAIRTDRQFNVTFSAVSLGLGALLTAALAIQPSLFSILLIETLALTIVPILSPPGKPLQQGVIRFLAFQTIGIKI